jgi:hypothetical protein
MTDHLTPEQFEKYRRGRVSSRDLAEIDQHVAQCAKCREGLADFELAREFFSDLLGVERIEFAHPTYERFSAYVDGKSNEEDRRKIEGHLVLCGSCRDQLAVLQEFARQMNKQKGKSASMWDRLSAKVSETFRPPPSFAPAMGALDQESDSIRGTMVRVKIEDHTAVFRSDAFGTVGIGDVFDIFRRDEDPQRVASAKPIARLTVNSLTKDTKMISGFYEGDAPMEGDILYLRRKASTENS